MKRISRAGVLAGALAFVMLGSGASAAAPSSPRGEGGDEVITVEEFFTPGPETVVKLNADYAGPTLPGIKAAFRDTLVPTVKNVKYQGQQCGTTLIQQTSGRGKTTLVMTVEKSVAATTKKEASIDLKFISAGMGWDVTKTYTVKNETRYEVPAGKFGTVQAYPLFEQYQGTAFDRFGTPLGNVYAYKPVGVCFNQHLK
ncbi:hypothetical protein [Streptomyces sp. SP18CS02]|uniref:hypothetical protein n=1 Tax=Streptomyces sp. SP18CS02 TaxID=3002531 RepID=UPI002E7A4198|nr:hypothetical protein [Streptomyces sp. SP18CS02]MEE1751056.1 hypothetical protein [Streptomyces sp. SP18CS02]